jgi:hypothetical protein
VSASEGISSPPNPMPTSVRLLPLLVLMACGGPAPTTGATVAVSTGGAPGAAVVAAPSPGSGSSGGTVAVVSAGAGPAAAIPPAAPPPPPPPEHPFAASASEATSLIDAAVDSRASSLFPCIMAARAHRKNPHEKIQIEIGLDQEGHLMAVKAPHGAPNDPELFQCAQKALAGANFPTSHAGIITVTKTFEDQAVYK